MRCGTTRSYQLGCRCGKCSEAARLYMREYRATKQGKKKTLLHNKRARKLQQMCFEYLRDNNPKVLDKLREQLDREFPLIRGYNYTKGEK